jgi:hypothetical protein
MLESLREGEENKSTMIYSRQTFLSLQLIENLTFRSPFDKDIGASPRCHWNLSYQARGQYNEGQLSTGQCKSIATLNLADKRGFPNEDLHNHPHLFKAIGDCGLVVVVYTN